MADKENSTLLRAQVAEHAIKVEDDERKFNHAYTWNSCCLRVDRRALSFFTQAAFSAAIVGFCIAMLSISQDCETFSRYSPLLTLVIGVWLPSPKLNSE